MRKFVIICIRIVIDDQDGNFSNYDFEGIGATIPAIGLPADIKIRGFSLRIIIHRKSKRKRY